PMISVSLPSTYLAPSISAWKVGAMNSPSCSMVGLRKTGAVSRMKSFQNCPGASSASGGGVRRIVRYCSPCAPSGPAKDSSTMKTTRWPRRRSTSPMPTQLLVGPNAPSGKNTMVRARSATLLKISGMDFGIGYFPTADAVGPGELAAFVEERGFSSLVFAEHTHIPASRESPYPGGGDLPRKYTATYDLFVALTAAALATSRLRVGSGVCLVIERDPIITAKEGASIDHRSGGRFEFGVGAGWNREEMANHGTDPRTRMRRMRESVEAMQAIWSQAEAS